MGKYGCFHFSILSQVLVASLFRNYETTQKETHHLIAMCHLFSSSTMSAFGMNELDTAPKLSNYSLKYWSKLKFFFPNMGDKWVDLLDISEMSGSIMIELKLTNVWFVMFMCLTKYWCIFCKHVNINCLYRFVVLWKPEPLHRAIASIITNTCHSWPTVIYCLKLTCHSFITEWLMFGNGWVIQ